MKSHVRNLTAPLSMLVRPSYAWKSVFISTRQQLHEETKHSGIAEHCFNNMHPIEKANVKILKENLTHFKPRKLVESFHIRNIPSNCNRVLGVHLPEIYLSLINS